MISLSTNSVFFKKSQSKRTYEMYARKFGVVKILQKNLNDFGIRFKLISVMTVDEANNRNSIGDSNCTTHIVKFKEDSDEAAFILSFHQYICKEFPAAKTLAEWNKFLNNEILKKFSQLDHRSYLF